MPFWSKKASEKKLRIFYVTDVHGSEPTFRKFINAGKIYDVDVLILGGDITGKMLIPIIDLGNQTFRATSQGMTQVYADTELPDFIGRLGKLGFYSAVMSEAEFIKLSDDPKSIHQLFLAKAEERLASWIRLAEERLAGTKIRCYVTGGNDDDAEVLAVLPKFAQERVVPCEEKLVELDDEGHIMVSLGYSNPTPWQTPREVEEDVLSAHIENAFNGISDFSKLIFNMHVPPVDSTLDTCPMLDPSTDPPTIITAGGEPVMFGAGSKAVSEAIQRYQPLLSLHGHIHESRGAVKLGRTLAINPGSEYGEGILRGAIVNIAGSEIESYQLTSG